MAVSFVLRFCASTYLATIMLDNTGHIVHLQLWVCRKCSAQKMRQCMTGFSRRRTIKVAVSTSFALVTWMLSPFFDSAMTIAQTHTLKVALFVDKGASASDRSDFKKEFNRSDDINYTEVYGEDIRRGVLKNFEILVVPGGSAGKDARSMGPEAREEVRRFVKSGGIYMGVCAGAYLASQQREFYLGMLPLKTIDSEHWYRTADGTTVDVEMTPLGMDVFGVSKSNLRIFYENGPIFALPPEPPDESFAILGTFRSEVVADGGTEGVMVGAPASILCRYGRGIVLVLSPHPESTPGLKTMEVHALHWLYDHRNQGESSTTASDAEAPKSPLETLSLSQRAVNLADSIFEHASEVRYVHKEQPASAQVTQSSDGSFDAKTDCSGFISYIVHALAPRHYHVVREMEPGWSYPQAKIWARFFDTLDGDQPRGGWLGIKNWKDLQPGDIIAWEKGQNTAPENHNTGHVMMVMDKPGPLTTSGGYRYIQIRVMDSSTTYHFAPESLPPNAAQKHRNGLGIGYVRIILSDDDKPVGYWAGTYSGAEQKQVNGPTMSDMIRFGRMTSLSRG